VDVTNEAEAASSLDDAPAGPARSRLLGDGPASDQAAATVPVTPAPSPGATLAPVSAGPRTPVLAAVGVVAFLAVLCLRLRRRRRLRS
jgi:hypothetical protein